MCGMKGRGYAMYIVGRPKELWLKLNMNFSKIFCANLDPLFDSRFMDREYVVSVRMGVCVCNAIRKCGMIRSKSQKFVFAI